MAQKYYIPLPNGIGCILSILCVCNSLYISFRFWINTFFILFLKGLLS